MNFQESRVLNMNKAEESIRLVTDDFTLLAEKFMNNGVHPTAILAALSIVSVALLRLAPNETIKNQIIDEFKKDLDRA